MTSRARPSPPPAVVLGSGSRYRRELLARLLPDFEVLPPAVDETPLPGESAPGLAQRLARLKAIAVGRLRPAAVVIGSDQVAECEGRALGKPGSAEKAVAQLIACSGRIVTLHTAVCLLGPAEAGTEAAHLDQTRLQLRALPPAALARYVEVDQPLDCAGSFRFEGLGAALFSSVETRDPTAIQGLPLMWVAAALSEFGIDVLGQRLKPAR
jgi:septum formation protein